MKMVYVCSPYKGNVEYNTAKAQGYCRFIYSLGAVPIAVHLHNTRFLDDSVSEERRAGMLMGLHMLNRCDELWVFGARISEGMDAEIKAAQRLGIPIQYYNDRCQELNPSENEKSPPVLQHQTSLDKNMLGTVYHKSADKE